MPIYFNYAWKFSFNTFVCTLVIVPFADFPQIHFSAYLKALIIMASSAKDRKRFLIALINLPITSQRKAFKANLGVQWIINMFTESKGR